MNPVAIGLIVVFSGIFPVTALFWSCAYVYSFTVFAPVIIPVVMITAVIYRVIGNFVVLSIISESDAFTTGICDGHIINFQAVYAIVLSFSLGINKLVAVVIL